MATVHVQAWQPIFFEEINNRAKFAKLASLRKVSLPEDDLELRIWIGFGAIPLEGFVIKRRSSRWAQCILDLSARNLLVAPTREHCQRLNLDGNSSGSI